MSHIARRRLLRRRPRPVAEEQAAPSPRSSAFIPQRWLRQLNPIFDWLVAAFLFSVTTVGNTGLFGANSLHLLQWSYWQTPLMHRALVWSVGMQLVVQLIQWANAHNKRGWRYRVALETSAIPNCWTYVPLVLFLLVRRAQWGSLYWPVALAVAGLVVVAVHAVDVLQEVLIVRD